MSPYQAFRANRRFPQAQRFAACTAGFLVTLQRTLFRLNISSKLLLLARNIRAKH